MSLNPFRQDAHLDILASVKDFELTGLCRAPPTSTSATASPRASCRPGAQLQDRGAQAQRAPTRIFLDQLTFGDKVDSPDAVNLPVQLAVSLLRRTAAARSICICRSPARWTTRVQRVRPGG
ncbi:hypothetical protein [Thauera humireducens]|uniref:hypothetical protein n=1 Tax=Thauera humireducens TaxID=1134435 RepID=UPI00311D6D4C